MSYRITGLDPSLFAAVFVDADALAARGGRRSTATESPGYPCRISLEDARPGEEVVLLPFEHHPAASPYRGAGPIYIRRDALRYDARAVPPMLRSRTLSVRAYDARGDLVRAELCPGTDVEPVIARLLEPTVVVELHVHFAATGCFACRVVRA